MSPTVTASVIIKRERPHEMDEGEEQRSEDGKRSRRGSSSQSPRITFGARRLLDEAGLMVNRRRPSSSRPLAMAVVAEERIELEKYREAFVRNYARCFAHLPDEVQRVEAINGIFDGIKTPSELASVALNLKALLPGHSPTATAITTIAEPKGEEIPEESAEAARNLSASPDSFDKSRERPAQNKLAREIEVINKRIFELFEQRKQRELSVLEQVEMRNALALREDLRKRLKKTQDAASNVLLSTESDGADTPALKFSRSLSSNVLMSSDEELERRLPAAHLTILTRPGLSFDDSFAQPALPLGVTPTAELDCAPGSVSEKDRQSGSAEDAAVLAIANSDADLCDRVFSSAQERLAHLSEHFTSTSATYKCSHCETTFPTASAFRQHFASTHTELLFRCNVCYRVFTENGVYQEHMNTHYVEEVVVECAVCALPFDSQENFLAHIQLVHDREPAPESALDTHRLLRHCKVPRSNRCGVCRQDLADLSDFFLHTKEHSSDQADVSCIVCRQTIRNEFLLKMHGDYHLGEDGQNANAEAIAAHLLQHTIDSTGRGRSGQVGSFHQSSMIFLCSSRGTFVCEKCPKTFTSLSALQGHSHIHVSRKFSCSKCRQVFTTLSRLQLHSKRHAGGKEAKCQICDGKFRDAEQLVEHMRSHAESLTAAPAAADMNA
ncbi:Zinc finger protein [Aphelenchoides fujianensis]|nr:Zinc finger protein [Aphelenchoides fujianensis]